MKRKIKREAEELFCYIILSILVVFVPPILYAATFCLPDLEAFVTTLKNGLELWVRIVLFALSLLVLIVNILILGFKIKEC
jgi:H+/Cl- antiporter ClcA